VSKLLCLRHEIVGEFGSKVIKSKGPLPFSNQRGRFPFCTDENQYPVSAPKPVLTGEISAKYGVSGHGKAKMHLTPCPAGYFLQLMTCLQRQKQNSLL
jgi:hypothetical protein